MRNHDPRLDDSIRLVQLVGTQATYIPSDTYHLIRDHRLVEIRHPQNRPLYYDHYDYD